MLKYILSFCLCCSVAGASAQTVADVLRYSRLQPSGSARFLGIGGAMGALGADYGALTVNPASLAGFRSDELVVSPMLDFSNVQASLPGNPTNTQTKSNFGFSNFGLVFNTSPRHSRWTTFNVAIGMNRLTDYNQSIFYEGDAGGTLMNGFFEEALAVNGDPDQLYPFGSQLAWDANAIYFDNNNQLTYDFAGNTDATINRSHTLTSSGRMNEMNLSFAGCYEDKLSVGMTVGVPFVNYRLQGEYIESDLNNAVEYFDGLTYTESLRTEGIGINAQLGLNYRVTQAFRLGLGFQSPTLLNLTDSYETTFAYDYTDGDGPVKGQELESPQGRTDYKLRTPWRATASTALLFNKSGFISADVEWVDYTANNYNLDANTSDVEAARAERELNNEIARTYRQAMNIRVGGEWAPNQFRVRGGLNFIGKPLAEETGFSTAYTIGAGLRHNSFYLDLAYRRFVGKGSVQPYADAPVANTDVRNSDLLLTLGFKF